MIGGINLFSPASYASGHPTDQYAWLRDNDPVHWHSEPDGPGFWAVTRYEDVKALSRNTALFSSRPTIMIDDGSAMDLGDHTMMLTMDPPRHTQYRKLVAPRFLRRAVGRMRPEIERLAAEIIDGVADRDEFDLVEDVAGLLPSYVIAEMLGIPRQDGVGLYALTETIHADPASQPAGAGLAAVLEMFSYASGVYDPRPMFKTELELFVDSILRSDRSVIDLLTADHTYVNEQIALLYGIEDIKGGGFRRVVLKDPKRHGLLGKGAVLMLTANPNRTAPVLRGAWILDRVLGTPPNNPPPGVPALSETKADKPTTVRGLVELHRRNPTCAMCHSVMDPLGFSLENFDTVGQFHTIDPQSRQPIDTAAVMPDGTKMSGPEDLAKVLASHGDQFAGTITQRLMTYAVGRPIDYRDMPTVRRITRQAAARNYTFESIVLGVVNSDSFRQRAPSPLPALITAQAAKTSN